MNENSQNFRLMPVPEIFYSSETNGLISECTICNKELLESNELYFIEKGIKNYPNSGKTDVIFEYAICETCMENMRKSISEESLERISKYMFEKIDFNSRMQRLFSQQEVKPDDWTSSCIVKNTNKETLDEYQVMCQCYGREAVFSLFPYMIGGEALEEIQNLLSKKTKEELDGFYDKYLGPSPEIKELFKTKVLII